MTLLALILVLLLAGIFVFLVNKAPFIDAQWKTWIGYAVLVFVVIWLVGSLLGGFGQLTNIRIGKQ